ncbi:unnamed protein product [Notodromas monacha]|uniref:Reticulocalbin-3 n=1 Tax=Notodromas monacha TaxID=399045 RepID=A0A7R9BMJ1_9CRUS|nr:unnamed protein product [Notodromas monacha]CAG0918252.1 unnamed protein product [Notodromas monacha]
MRLFSLAVAFAPLLCVALAAVAHVHEQAKPGQRERTDDGAFSPKDSSHYGPGGEHKADFDHEAILGSAKAAKEFDDLPPDEAKARLAELAKTMDVDKDGGINRKELNQWILRSLSLLSKEDAEDQFADLDVDANGKITWREVLEDFAEEDSDEVLDDKEIFENADVNKDGALDKHEFKHYTHPEESDVMRPLLVKQSLREKDRDGDGALNFQEFLGEDAKDKDKAWLLSEKAKFDAQHDRDRDGVLKEAEIADWLLPDNEDIAKEETSHLFAYADENHDDILSLDEIVKHHEVFVGSEATDFGEHLSEDRLESLPGDSVRSETKLPASGENVAKFLEKNCALVLDFRIEAFLCRSCLELVTKCDNLQQECDALLESLRFLIWQKDAPSNSNPHKEETVSLDERVTVDSGHLSYGPKNTPPPEVEEQEAFMPEIFTESSDVGDTDDIHRSPKDHKPPEVKFKRRKSNGTTANCQVEKQCPVCGIPAVPGLFTQHMREAHPESKYRRPVLSKRLECALCSFTAKTKSRMTQHRNCTHGLGPKYPCPHCGLLFKRKFALTVHEHKEHLKTPLRKCGECGKEFFSIPGLLQHVSRHHPKKPVQTRVCDECGLQVDAVAFYSHSAKHRKDKMTYPCSHCDRVFTCKTYRRRHTAKYHGVGELKMKSCDRLKQCSECGKQMKNDEAFRAHMFMKHNIKLPGLRQLDCRYCDRVFYVKALFRSHVMVHTGEKHFKCNICGYGTRFSGNLTKHKKFVHKITPTLRITPEVPTKQSSENGVNDQEEMRSENSLKSNRMPEGKVLRLPDVALRKTLSGRIRKSAVDPRKKVVRTALKNPHEFRPVDKLPCDNEELLKRLERIADSVKPEDNTEYRQKSHDLRSLFLKKIREITSKKSQFRRSKQKQLIAEEKARLKADLLQLPTHPQRVKQTKNPALIYGINKVMRAVERGNVSLVFVDAQDRVCLVANALYAACRAKGIPAMAVENLGQRLGTVLSLKSMICAAIDRNADQGQVFHDFALTGNWTDSL